MTKDNQMIYLSIHNIKDGQKTFNAGTRYDWYVIQKKKAYKNTTMIDENNNKLSLDLTKFKWLPNYDISNVQKILASENDDKCDIMYSRTNYGSDKIWISETKDKDFKYSCIHSTPKAGVRYMYSKFKDKGHSWTSDDKR